MHVCPECDKKMATAGGLEIHMELAHRPGAPPVEAEPVAAMAGAPVAAPYAAAAALDIVPLERPRRESKLTAVPVLFFAIVSLLVAGVASALVRNSGGPSTPLAMVQASASTTASAGTAQVSATVKGGGLLANGVTVDGGFDFDNRRASLEVDPSKLGVSGVGKIEAIADYSSGFVMYMKFPPQLSSELGGKPWVKIDLGSLLKQAGVDVDLGALAQGQSNDPTSGLRLLRGASSVANVGTEQVRGVDTTHYDLTVNLDKAIAEAPASERDALTKLANLYTTRTFPVQVWLDAQGRVRRFQQMIDPSTIRLPAGTSAKGNPFAAGPVTMTYELYDFGSQVDAKIPPADQVTDLNDLIRQGR